MTNFTIEANGITRSWLVRDTRIDEVVLIWTSKAYCEAWVAEQVKTELDFNTNPRFDPRGGPEGPPRRGPGSVRLPDASRRR